MKVSIIIAMVFTLIGCTAKNSVVEGSVYIKLVDVGSFYPMNLDKIEQKVAQLEVSSDSGEFVDFYRMLQEDKLIDKPYFNLITGQNEKVKIYTTQEEYHKMDWKRFDSINNSHTLKLNAQIIKTNNGFMFAPKIMEITFVQGATMRKK